jgi:hypothetical protein
MNIVEKDVDKAVDKGRALAEWHRYELGTEDRLPRCWPRHPGLVEELWALRAWRLEVYSGGQPSGQAARVRPTERTQRRIASAYGPRRVAHHLATPARWERPLPGRERG